jgi:hypothetical protein
VPFYSRYLCNYADAWVYDIVGDLFLIPNMFSYADTAKVDDFSVDLHLTYGLEPQACATMEMLNLAHPKLYSRVCHINLSEIECTFLFFFFFFFWRGSEVGERVFCNILLTFSAKSSTYYA